MAVNLHAGQWTAVKDLAGRSWEDGAVAIEWPGPESDLPFFSLMSVEPADGDEFLVFGMFMESDRVWLSLFKGDELLLVDPV